MRNASQPQPFNAGEVPMLAIVRETRRWVTVEALTGHLGKEVKDMGWREGKKLLDIQDLNDMDIEYLANLGVILERA